ncbi:MAG: hypothetical protein HOC24_14735 [Deltaproteobacteria bacterium]|nr:hypothetical protein [Deltaproteobacteria bacterium]
MSDFLEKINQVPDLLRFWKSQLQMEEALQKTLTPVPPNIANHEGRPYFKIHLPDESQTLLYDFLLRNNEQFQLDISNEALPFLNYIFQQDKLSRRYNQDIEHEFFVGFPTIFYKNKYGQEKLSVPIKLSLLDIKYPDQKTLEGSGPKLLKLIQEKEDDQGVGFSYFLDEFFLQEELGISDNEIIAFRRKLPTNEKNPFVYLKYFSELLLGFKIDCEPNEIFNHLFDNFQKYVQKIDNYSQNVIPLNVYPYLIVYELENNQPTRQLQNDLSNIINWDLIEELPTKHPAKYYLFGNNNEKSKKITTKIYGSSSDQAMTPSQLLAVKAIKDRSLTAVVGPPGTGKTHIIRNTIADRIVNLASSLEYTDQTVYNMNHLTVVTSTNNRAVDNAIEGFEQEQYLPFTVRMGSRIVLSRFTKQFLIDYIFTLKSFSDKSGESTFKKAKKVFKKYLKAADLEKDISNAAGFELFKLARDVLNAWVIANKNQVIRLLKSIIAEIEEKRSMMTLRRKKNLNLFMTIFPVIGTTLLSMRNFFPMEEDLLGLLIIDESGQCIPSYVFPALVRSKKAAILGDTKQLEPIVNIRDSEIANIRKKRKIELSLDKLLFFASTAESPISAQHIALTACKHRVALKDHFRCLNNIINVCIDLCDYELNVQNSTHLEDEKLAQLQFLNINVPEIRYGSSWVNHGEVKGIIDVIRHCLGLGFVYNDMAVLTPFRGQLSFINTALKKERFPFFSGTDPGVSGRQNIITGTVHRFQGGERKIIIFSSVINIGEPGFLNSRVNLLNVAVSRAMKSFIFVGSVETLSKGTFTDVLKEHLILKGQQLSLP